MTQTREELIVIIDTQCRNLRVAVQLELWTETEIMFASQNLRWNTDGVDFFFRQHRRMCCGDTFDQILAYFIVSIVSKFKLPRGHAPLAPSWKTAHPP